MNTMRDNIRIWKMAWFKVGLVAVLAGFTTLQTSLNGITWEALNSTQKVLLAGGVGAAICTSLIAFLDKTISRIETEQKTLADNPSATTAIKT